MHTTSNPTPNSDSTPRQRRLLPALLGGGVGAAILSATLLLGGGSAGAIVNGTPTTASSSPWQVSLQDSAGHYCGGSVLDATTIVTAAHCVEGETAAGTTIRAGVTNSNDTSGQDVAVASITSYPGYADTGVGDIAVIKLAEPLRLGGDVQAIPAASRQDIAGAANATVTGWGALSENGGDSPEQLLTATVPLVDDATCNAQLGTDAAGEVCAGGTGTDSCYGDSGGPLVVQTADGPKLAGVVSWGEECGGPTPGVYAEVPNYVDFLNGGTVTPADTADTPADVDSDDEIVDDSDNGDEMFDDSDFHDEMFDDSGFGDGDEWIIEEFIDGAWVEIDTAEWTDADWDAFDAENEEDADYYAENDLDFDDFDDFDDIDGLTDDELAEWEAFCDEYGDDFEHEFAG